MLHSMFAPLQSVLVRRPDEAFGAADPARWHYADQPYLPLAQQEHDALVLSLIHISSPRDRTRSRMPSSA